MLVTMKEMLADARERHYAIPAFDVSNYEMIKTVLDTCEEERSPALLMGLGVDLQGKGMNLIPALVKEASKFYNVPICFHLDHAGSMELIQQAAAAGFSSVMFDGSDLPFDQNAEKTAEVVRFAHANGLTVEAELGHVGNAIVGNESDSRADEDPETTLTDPTDVVKFVELTDVDALAVAIGTAHGVYRKTPTLRIDRLDEITSVCSLPLVLHGGSGTPDDQMQTAIRHGITKINIYSDVVAAFNRALLNKLSHLDNPAIWPAFVFEEARAAMKEVARTKLRTFGSSGKV